MTLLIGAISFGMQGLPWGFVLGISLVLAFLTVLVEAISHHGLDNFTVQVAVAGSAAYLI
jgi:dolichol kinase